MPRHRLKRRKTSSKRKASSKSRRSSSKRSTYVKGHGAYKTYKKSSSKKKKKSSVVRSMAKKFGKSLAHEAGKGIGNHIGSSYGYKVSEQWLPKAGAAVGSMFGPLGSFIGEHLGSAIGSVTGHGDYKVTSNTLAIPGTQIPSFDRNGRSCTRFRHREMAFDLRSSTSQFSNTTYSLNPCNTILFPWLADQMANFQEYSWEGLIIEFRSESGVAVSSTNTSLGYVSIATNYDATQPAFVNKQQMNNAEFSVEGPPSSNILHIIECKRTETALNNLYTNAGFVPAGADQRLFDIGVLNIAVGNQQAGGNVLGTVWLSYDICAYKPIVGFSGISQNTAHYVATTGVTSGSNPLYFGSNPFQASGSTMALSLGNNTITFPENAPTGTYLMQYSINNSLGTSSTATGNILPSVILQTNCTPTGIYQTDANSGLGNTLAFIRGNGTNMMTQQFLTLTGPSAVIKFTSGNLFSTGAINNMDLLVTQLNSNIT